MYIKFTNKLSIIGGTIAIIMSWVAFAYYLGTPMMATLRISIFYFGLLSMSAGGGIVLFYIGSIGTFVFLGRKKRKDGYLK